MTLVVVGASARWLPRWSLPGACARDLVRYSSYSILTRLGYFLGNNVDRIIIGYLLGPASLGIYSLAKRVTEMMSTSITGVVAAVAHPLFAREQTNLARLRAVLASIMDRLALLAFPAFLGLASVAPDAVPLVFGAKWIDAVPVLQIMSVLAALYSVSVLHGALVRAMGRIDWWSGFVNLISVVYAAGFIVASRFGIVAVAATALAMFALLTPLHFWMVMRLIDLRPARYLTIFLVPIAASVAMAMLILVMRRHGWFPAVPLFGRVAIEIAVGMAAYGVMVAILAPRRARTLLSQLRGSEASP
jgi:O-antigen/teichoic acid export membrane protein